MSETIILIMTSSSTRNTEPRGGRVAFMTSVLAHPSRSTFAKISTGCNFYLGLRAAPGCDCTANKPHWNGIAMRFREQEQGLARKCSFSHRSIMLQMVRTSDSPPVSGEYERAQM